MIYLTGVSNDAIRSYAATEPDLGLMTQPRSGVESHVPSYAAWAADNGAFGAWRQGTPFAIERWRRWLATLPGGPLFAVVPDSVGDHEATRALWAEHAGTVADQGFRTAFVLQNGCVDAEVPREADAVFVGGDDEFKLGWDAARLCWQARERGQWVHMGRVNSRKRWCRALAMGCDSADGTFLRFGPADVMLARLGSWLRAGRVVGGALDLLDSGEVSA